MTVTLGPTNQPFDPSIPPVHTRTIRLALATTLAAGLVTTARAQGWRFQSARTGARSARRAPAAPARSPACPSSPTSSTSASTTAACGARPTTARTGCRSSTASRPARSARSASRRPIPTSSTSAPAPGIIRPDLAIGDGDVQVHRRRQDVDAPRPARQPDDRDDRRRSDESEPAVRRRARASVRAQRRARNLPLDRRRPDVPEGAIQGRVHERQRRADRSVERNIVYATLWQQQQSFIEGGGFGGVGRRASTSRPTAARRGSRSPRGCRSVIQANIAIAPSNSRTLYAMVAGDSAAAGGGGAAGAARGAAKHRYGALQVDGRAASTGSCAVGGGADGGRAAAAACSRTRGRSRASAAATCRRSPSIRRTRTSSTARPP